MANIKFEVILEMFFLKISNVDILFGKKILTQRTYTINKILSTTEQIQIVNPKELIIVVLDFDSEIFVVYMAIQE